MNSSSILAGLSYLATEKRLQIKDSIKKLDQLRVDGILSDSEHKEFLAVKEAALEETKIEIDAHNEADHQTFKEGLRVIELFINVWNFMQKPGKELEKARLAKWVLSNPTLTDRTLQFHYEKPFDVLLQLAGQQFGGPGGNRSTSSLSKRSKTET